MTAPLTDPHEKIRVLLVDDSVIARRLLTDLINQTPDMQVIGEASTGLEAVRMNLALNPHIVAMDLTMPLLDGLQAAQLIMQEKPNRIVLFAEADQLGDPELAKRVAAVGALDICPKPRHADDEDHATRLIKTLRALSRVKVIHHWRKKTDSQSNLAVADEHIKNYPGLTRQPEGVFIICSTGGPPALEKIFKDLPADFPLPIVVLQHIDGEFVGNMINWLQNVTPLQFRLAVSGERPMPGYIYIAPSGYHLRLAFNGRFRLDSNAEGYIHVPCGDVLLESVAEILGPNAIGVVLTGMGSDGAAGLLRMREQGAHTIAQDEASSVVFGMPKEAIALGAAEFVMPLDQIASLLVRLAGEGKKDERAH